MINKCLLPLLFLVLASATTDAATWKVHNCFMSSKIQNVYDTGDMVYYVNAGALYQFDKSTTKTTVLNEHNKLTGSQVSQIYYDWQNQLLFVAYLDANIDIIDADGKVYNVNNLKKAIVSVRNYTITPIDGLTSYTGKTVNDITFADGIAYVTVDYGYVTIDESSKRLTNNVTLAHDNVTNINSVAVIGNKMVFLTDTYCYYGAKGAADPINSFSKFSGSFRGSRMYPIDDNSLFALNSSSLYRYNFSTSSPGKTQLVAKAPTSVQKTSTGFIANFAGQNFYYTIDPTGQTATMVTATASFASSCPTGNGDVWINDTNGLHVQGSSTNYKMNTMTTDEPYWLKYNAALDKLYAGTSALNGRNRTNPNNQAENIINSFDGINWQNVTPYSTAASYGGYEFEFNPFDPTTYVRATWSSGLQRVKNDSRVYTYTSSNSRIGTYKAHPAFDNYGNLWVVSSFGNASCPVAVLPKAKFDKSSVVKTDWFQPSGLLALNTEHMQRSRFIISKKNNVKIYCDCDNDDNIPSCSFIHVWDNDNVDPTVNNYRFATIKSFVDQNNRQISWNYILHMEQDNDGMIWAGYMDGLFVFDPEDVFDEHPKAIRPVTTKSSEGKGVLCEGYNVYDIGVTRNNEKWIATTNGVYYVSPDGSELYNHFTTENSDLPSNVVYSVECDTIHDRVYVFTDNGFAEYIADGDAAALDFNGVYAFPSPVEPDFTGMVKITGLMENSYVTITNRNGYVVARMGPVMGSTFWDVCGTDGERVPTGLYKVYAAQGSQPSTTGDPQATIMVIK